LQLRVVPHLLPDERENGALITGPHYRGIRVLSELIPLTARTRTRTYYEADPASMFTRLLELQEQGQTMTCWGHSHPFGNGPGATAASTIDFEYLAGLQEQGSDAIGLIVSRSNERAWVRFFSVYVPIRGIHIHGGGVTPVPEEKCVYELALQTSADRQRDRHEFARSAALDS
jgi:hypothetical protein